MHDALHPPQLNKEKNSLLIPALIKDILTKKWFYVLCFIFFILGVITNAPYSFLPEIMDIYYDMKGLDNVLVLTFFNFAVLFGSVIFGFLLSKISSKLCFSGIVFFLIAGSVIFSFISLPEYIDVLILYCNGFILASLSPALSLYVQEKTCLLKFVSVYTIFSICTTIGNAADTYLVGLWYHITKDLIFVDFYGVIFVAAAGVAALWLGITEIRQKNRSSEEPSLENMES